MLRSILKAGAITIIGLALVVLASMLVADAANAAAPKKKIFRDGVVCSLQYELRNGDVVAIASFGPSGLSEFTLRRHIDGWDQLSFKGQKGVIPINSAAYDYCPIIFPKPFPPPAGVT